MSGAKILEIDAGNTRAKWRLVDSNRMVAARGVSAWADLQKESLDKEWSPFSIARVDLACVASKEKKDQLDQVLDGLDSRPSRIDWVSAQGMGGIQFAYSNISKLGLDRVLAMVAAYNDSAGGSLVLDAGSALTADFVAGDGEHLGGFIFPGVSMLRQSLLSGTSNVYASPDMLGNAEFGKDTEECVEHAITVMLLSTIGHLTSSAKDRGIQNIFLTGGDLNLLAPLMPCDFNAVPELVLDGLSCLREMEEGLR